VLVKHLRYPLTAALERLMAKDPTVHPFVIVEANNADSFLQYAGSAGERLIFDVPQQDIQMECDGVAHAVLSAEQLIEKNWCLGDDDTVTIIEDENNGIRRRAKQWFEKLKGSLRLLPEPA
jgi:dTDP-glucose pyrophosphorylase